MKIKEASKNDTDFLKRCVKHYKKRKLNFFLQNNIDNFFTRTFDKEEVNHILILWKKDKRVGVVNFYGDCFEDESLDLEIDIFLSPHYKNKGYGSILYYLSEQWLCNKYDGYYFYLMSNVDSENINANKAFRSWGFRRKYGVMDYFKRFDLREDN